MAKTAVLCELAYVTVIYIILYHSGLILLIIRVYNHHYSILELIVCVGLMVVVAIQNRIVKKLHSFASCIELTNLCFMLLSVIPLAQGGEYGL